MRVAKYLQVSRAQARHATSVKRSDILGYTNKICVCFDRDHDLQYYQQMCAWKQNDYTKFDFYSAYNLQTTLASSSEAEVKWQLRQRLARTKVVVVLIGEKSRHLPQFTTWELEQALELELPIIGVNLNGRREQDPERCPAIIRDALAIHVSFNPAIVQHALQTWPDRGRDCKRANNTRPRSYVPEVYQQFGI